MESSVGEEIDVLGDDRVSDAFVSPGEKKITMNGREYGIFDFTRASNGILEYRSRLQHGDGTALIRPSRRRRHIAPGTAPIDEVTKITQNTRGISIYGMSQHMPIIIEHFDVWGFKNAVPTLYRYFIKKKRSWIHAPSMQPFMDKVLYRFVKNWHEHQQYPLPVEKYSED